MTDDDAASIYAPEPPTASWPSPPADAPTRDRPAAATDASALRTPTRDAHELRLALVMNGGVSLAVWIGGVTCEIASFVGDVEPDPSGRTRDDGVYGAIRRLLATRTRVDVLCGTSAGGINAAYLALAIARQGRSVDVTPLRDVWVQNAGIEDLLRNPFSQDPPSILDGDGAFMGEIKAALGDVRQSPDAERDPVELVLTTTLLEGKQVSIPDAFGSTFTNTDHRASFAFSRGSGRDDFSAAGVVGRLAVAARSTASFPVAFEPRAVVASKPKDGGDPNPLSMAGLADFATDELVVDGGILDNSPIDLALDRIFRQEASGPVRRLLAFVVPDPGRTPDVDPPKAKQPPPTLLDVAVACTLTIPRTQSVTSQIGQLAEHNRRVRQRRRDRIALTAIMAHDALDAASTTLFQAYQAQRALDAVGFVLGVIEIGTKNRAPAGSTGGPGSTRGPSSGPGKGERFNLLCRAVASRPDRLSFVPTMPPLDGGSAAERTEEGWRWGVRPVEHATLLYLDIVKRSQGVVTRSRLILDLGSSWRSAYEALARVTALTRDRTDWGARAAEFQAALGRGLKNAEEWLLVELGPSPPQAREERRQAHAAEAARIARQVAKGIRELAVRVRPLLVKAKFGALPDLDAADLLSLINYLVSEDSGSDDEVLAKILALEVVQNATGDVDVKVEQEIEYLQVSADQPSALGGPAAIEDRLTGLQLGHFGAFYKASWRANDWMWGRLDGARRLVAMLLDPERLRIVARDWPDDIRRSEHAAGILEDAAAGPLGRPCRDELRLRFPKARVVQELAYLDDPGALAPPHLPLCCDALTLRLHVDILLAELPAIKEALLAEAELKERQSFKLLAFRDACPTKGDRPSLADLEALMGTYALGKARIAADVGTDRLSVLATQTLAVLFSAIRGDAGWLKAAGGLLRLLRAPTLAAFILARNAYIGANTGLIINVAAFAAAIAILSVAIATHAVLPKPVLLVAAGVVAYAVGVLVLRASQWLMALALAGAALTASSAALVLAGDKSLDHVVKVLGRPVVGASLVVLTLGLLWLAGRAARLRPTGISLRSRWRRRTAKGADG